MYTCVYICAGTCGSTQRSMSGVFLECFLPYGYLFYSLSISQMNKKYFNHIYPTKYPSQQVPFPAAAPVAVASSSPSSSSSPPLPPLLLLLLLTH